MKTDGKCKLKYVGYRITMMDGLRYVKDEVNREHAINRAINHARGLKLSTEIKSIDIRDGCRWLQLSNGNREPDKGV